MDTVTILSILGYFWSLDTYRWPVEIFHGLFIIAAVLTSYAVLSSRLRFAHKIFLVMLWSVSIRLAIPFRLETGILSNDPDPLFVRQLAMSIFSTGVISHSGLTGFALNYYAQFPGLEILACSLSHVSRIEIDTILKFGGAFVGTLGLLLLILGFKRICGPFWAVVSGLIASTYTNLMISMIHGTIGLLFSIILVLGILHGKRPGTAIAIVALAAMVVAHDFTPVQITIVLCFASAFYAVFPNRQQRVLSLPALTLTLSTAFGAWILFTTGSALATFSGILTILRGTLEPALAEAPRIIYMPRMLSLIGLSAYALLLVVGFVLFVFRKTEKTMRIIFALCFGAAAYFIFGSLPFMLSSGFGITGHGGDVLPRSVQYLYLVGAPVAAVVLERLRFRRTPETTIGSAGSSALVPLTRISRKRIWAATFLVSVILMPTFYFFFVPMYYDINAPWVQMDVRLPLNEWQTAAEWVGAHSPLSPRVYGDMLAVTFIGAVGRQNILYIIEENLDIRYLLRSVPSAVILNRSSSSLLRESIPFDNLVYSDSGVLIVLVTRSANIMSNGTTELTDSFDSAPTILPSSQGKISVQTWSDQSWVRKVSVKIVSGGYTKTLSAPWSDADQRFVFA